MDNQLLLETIARFLHIFTAITLIGGGIYRLAVAGPVASTLPNEQSMELKIKYAAKWKIFVHTGILVFLVTGLYLYMVGIKYHRGDTLYHILIGIKMLLAIVVFFFISALVGRSEKLGFIRTKATGTLSIVLVLAVVIVGTASFLKTRGPQNWPAEKEPLPVKESSMKKKKQEDPKNGGEENTTTDPKENSEKEKAKETSAS